MVSLSLDERPADLKFFAAKGYEQHRSDVKALHDALAGAFAKLQALAPSRG